MSCARSLTYMGYYSNFFAREAARNVEKLTRPMPRESQAYWKEFGQRVGRTLSVCLSVPLAAALAVFSMASYSLAACLKGNRFEIIQPESPSDFWDRRSVKVMSLNACFQDPWSPLTGGVVTPFEPTPGSPNRVSAVVEAIDIENPDLFLGQEFENLGAQDESIRLLSQKGFRYFLRDLGSDDAIRNNSGLFVASKVPLNNIEFIPYPLKDRAGLAKWSNQGALTFTIAVRDKILRLVNVHLNYGEGKENQDARNRQLKNHVIPLLKKGNAVLFGDLNFDTASVEGAASGLSGFFNALEGEVTCTDAGKHALRNKSLTPGGKPCLDCEEKIDGLIYDPNQIEIIDIETKPLVSGNHFLTDHYATIASVQIC